MERSSEMKTSFDGRYLFNALAFAVLLLFFGVGCQKERLPVVPIYFPFEGSWLGNTSQMTYLQLEFMVIEQHPALYSISFTYFSDSAPKQRYFADENGLCAVDSIWFEYPMPDGSLVKGVFINENLVEGTISFETESNAQKEIIFSATTDGGPVTINSIARATFRIGADDYEYIQKIDYSLPAAPIFQNDSTLTVGSSLNTPSGRHLIRINAGNFFQHDDIAGFFHPGLKPFAGEMNDGIELIFSELNNVYTRWATTLGIANQQEGYFRLVEIKTITPPCAGFSRMKMMAEFACTVYNYSGDSLEIADGFYLGFVDIPESE
jgi:hypothetical protein